MLQPFMATPGKKAITRKPVTKFCLGNVIKLFACHERPIELNFFCHFFTF
jgi:hypothetical protein